jgi:GT2 family glycosyltransferase
MPNFRPPSLAVIVPATDSPPTLERCLAALERSSEPPDELIVVSDPPGRGPAGARNDGAAQADSELLAFVDADVAVDPEALARLRGAFSADPALAAAFGAYDDSPADPGAVSTFRNLLHHHVHTDAAGPAETFWAGLGAVRRPDFVAAGGFDAERYADASVEDIELGMRLRRSGARILLDPGVTGTHLKRWSLGSMVSTDMWRRGVPWMRLQLEAGRIAGSLNLGWRHRLSAAAALAAALAALARRPAAALAALAGMVALNVRFYALLRRRGGASLALIGVPLHLVHLLTAVCAVATAVGAHALARGVGR